MKLYLSSYRVPKLDDLISLVGISAKRTQVALIPNAKDYYVKHVRDIKIRDTSQYFQGLGFNTDVVDLVDFDNATNLKNKLDKYDLIWVMGGNSFILRYEMRRSGFETIINDLLQDGKVYGGSSAGAIVAGNSLHGIEFADNPEFAETVIWDGLKLIDCFILPHVGNQDCSEAIERARESHKNDKTLLELSDQQAIVVDGSKMKIVEGAKRRLSAN
jgi:dipeptidase E